MSMNIYAKNGDKVVFSYLNNGYDGDRADGKKYLRVGQVYTVEHTEVHPHYTHVWLKEIPAIRFNSVLFSDALEQLAAQSTPVEEVARKIAEKNCEHFADFCRAEYVERFTKEIAEQLRQHRYGAQAELGQALGNVLKKIGVINDIPLTGPELLLAAETYCNGAQWQGVGPKCPKSREEICSWTRKWFSDHRPANREDFDLADMLADFAQFFSPVPSPESAAPLHGICPNCGADRSGPSAEAHAANCPESATKECLGYPKCDGNLIGEPHEEGCPARESAEEKR